MDRLRALTQLDRKRLDAALMRIHGRPALMVMFNCILLGINSLGRLKRVLKTALARLGIARTEALTGSENLQALPKPFKQRVFPGRLSVLIVCEMSIPQCLRYRVEQKLEQLRILGLRSRSVDWTNYMEVNNQIAFHDVIIFYRVPGYPKMMANIEYAIRLGKITVYDTDDLIFDREILSSYYDRTTGQLSRRERKGVLRGAGLYRQAIRACRFAITTTEALKEQLERVLGEGAVYILPNGLDRHSQHALESIRPVKQPGKLTLFYGSGTRTHDQDFALVAPALARLMEKYQQLELVVVGYLTLPESLQALSSRIIQIGLLGIDEYLRVLAHADINLAPLAPGLFADCKSEIKWLEAGALGVPSVASSTRVYRQAIRHGRDGLVTADAGQWEAMLESIMEDETRRQALGTAAAQQVQENYSPEKLAAKFEGMLSSMSRTHNQENGFRTRDAGVRHVGIVNVLYPPQAMGGATVVACNIVETLKRDYAGEFQVSVFTCDINNIFAYQVSEYEYRGVRVTAVSVPVGPDVDYRGYDGHVGELFSQWLEHAQPDLVHFHSIQRLTAAMLEACLDNKIPYLVTVHDAWWVSDHQFLIDDSGIPVAEPQASPVVAARTSEHAQQTIQRTARLAGLLRKADKVLAVSEYQAQYYRCNGIENIIVNANGVDPVNGTERKGVQPGKVILGYCGSICHHKGYYFLRQVLEAGDFRHLSLRMIQFNLAEPRSETWNTVEVEFIPRLDPGRMGEFYASIDVLLAPSMWPESFGLITREAALAGIWMVAAEAGGLAEVVVPDENGFTYPMGDAQALADILNRVDQDPARFTRRVAAGQVAASCMNTVDQQVGELVNVYNSVLDSQSGPEGIETGNPGNNRQIEYGAKQ